MADDELLREALLELQFLREREARVLDASKTLVDCLEAYSTASSAGDALASIFVSFAQKIGATLSLLLAADDTETARVVAASHQSVFDMQLDLPFNPFARPRNVASLTVFDAMPDVLASYGAMIVVPVRDDLSLLTFRDAGETFKKTDIELVQRLSGLAAQALRDSELAARNELLAATIAGSSSGFAIADALDPTRPLIYVNEAFEALSGYTREEVLGQNCRFLSDEPPTSAERIRLRRAVADNASGTFVLRNKRKSGDRFWNELTLFPVMDAGGQVINLVATQTDVTERVEAAQARDQVRGWMDSALRATDDAFLVLDSDNQVALANGSVGLLFPAPGFDWAAGTRFDDNWSAYLAACEDFPGRVSSLLQAGDFDALTHVPYGFELALPDGRSVLVKASRLADGGTVVSATDVTAMKSAQNLLGQRLSAIEAASNGIAITDSTGRLTYLNSSAADLLGFATPQAAMGQKWRPRYIDDGVEATNDEMVQLRISDAKSGEIHTHEISVSDLATGGTVIVIRDETERLERDAREDQLEQDLVRLQGQEALAQLTAGIAHDFNNLLSVITGSATLMDMDEKMPADVRTHIKRILSAGNQSSSLINRLLDLGASDQAQGVFLASDVLSDLPDLVQAGLTDRQRFTLQTQEADVRLRGDASILSQILINLVFNARDAIPDSGDIRLETRLVSGAEDTGLVVGDLKAGADYMAFVVTDTGKGIAPDTAASIFDPYFTTKGAKGTGLGLATAALQVRMIGGAIGLDTQVGQGTTIAIYWPVRRDTARVEPRPAADQTHDLTGLTLIVVDDDPDVSAVTASYLEVQGAEVAQCQDPRDALEAVQDDPGAWTALITDYDMPEMNGGALVAEVRKSTTDLPIIVVTALAKRLNDPRLGKGNVTAILPKPVNLTGLSEALVELGKTD